MKLTKLVLVYGYIETRIPPRSISFIPFAVREVVLCNVRVVANSSQSIQHTLCEYIATNGNDVGLEECVDLYRALPPCASRYLVQRGRLYVSPHPHTTSSRLNASRIFVVHEDTSIQ